MLVGISIGAKQTLLKSRVFVRQRRGSLGLRVFFGELETTVSGITKVYRRNVLLQYIARNPG